MRERLTYICVIAALVIAIAFMARDCSSKEKQIRESQQNIDALIDTTRETRNKLNQVQFERTIFMGDVETLRKLNVDLVKELEKQKANTRVVTEVVTRVVIDTIYANNSVSKLDDSTFSVDFSYDKRYDSSNYISFKGNLPAQIKKEANGYALKSAGTKVTDMNLNMKIFTGINEENGKYSIFARTDFPGVKFNLDGAVVNPEESFIKVKRSPFSLMLGVGMGYGPTQSGGSIVPNVGLYVGINLFNF